MSAASKGEDWAKPETVNLPSELRISKFAEARIKEIKALSDFIGECWLLTMSAFFAIITLPIIGKSSSFTFISLVTCRALRSVVLNVQWSSLIQVRDCFIQAIAYNTCS